LLDEKHGLNLGCGDEACPECVNIDVASRPGVDIIHDLQVFPWPLPSDRFDEVWAIDLLEHLPALVPTMEEIWRVSRNNAVVHVRVPYWNSRWAWVDPQHLRGYTEETFGFFDPNHKYGRQRPYYSTARFTTESVTYEGCWLIMRWPFAWRAEGYRMPRPVRLLSKIGDMLHFLRIELRVLKS